jgi:hypothetical protein
MHACRPGPVAPWPHDMPPVHPFRSRLQESVGDAQALLAGLSGFTPAFPRSAALASIRDACAAAVQAVPATQA